MLSLSCDGAVDKFCLVVKVWLVLFGGESVAIRGCMEATFKNKHRVFLVGHGQGSKLLGFRISETPTNGVGNPNFGPGFPTGNPDKMA